MLITTPFMQPSLQKKLLNVVIVSTEGNIYYGFEMPWAKMTLHIGQTRMDHTLNAEKRLEG